MGGARRAALLAVAVAAIVAVPAASARAFADVQPVTTTEDRSLGEDPSFCSGEPPHGEECPLRAALESFGRIVFAPADELVVQVPEGHYTLTKGPLPVGDAHAASCTGAVKCPVVLRGVGAGRTVIDGDHTTRLLALVDSAGALAVERLTLVRGGSSTSSLGGGAITGEETDKSKAAQSLSVREAVLTENEGFEGGAIAVGWSPVTISDSEITANRAAEGAGVDVFEAPLTIERSTLAGNRAEGLDGGALFLNKSPTLIVDSTIAGNVATLHGGGIDAFGQPLTLRYSTVAGNTASSTGGGISSEGPGSKTPVAISGSILSGNVPEQCAYLEPAEAIGANIVFGPSSCAFAGPAPIAADPLLGPLAVHGGATETMGLLRGSPALNAGGPSCPGALVGSAPTDERGVARPVGSGCDLGAFESAANAAATLSASPGVVALGGVLTLTASAVSLGTEPLTGVSLTLPMPSTSTLLSASPGCLATFAPTPSVTCGAGSLAPGQTASWSISIRPEQAGTLVVNGSVAAEQADYEPSDDSATASSTVIAAAHSQPPPPSSGRPPSSTLLGRALKVDSHGYARARIRCAGPVVCSDTVSLYSRAGILAATRASVSRRRSKSAVLLASGRAAIAPGATVTVRLHLSRRVARAARKRPGLGARLRLSSRSSSGLLAEARTYPVTLRRS